MIVVRLTFTYTNSGIGSHETGHFHESIHDVCLQYGRNATRPESFTILKKKKLPALRKYVLFQGRQSVKRPG
jgi:hypothetical protein